MRHRLWCGAIVLCAGCSRFVPAGPGVAPQPSPATPVPYPSGETSPYGWRPSDDAGPATATPGRAAFANVIARSHRIRVVASIDAELNGHSVAWRLVNPYMLQVTIPDRARWQGGAAQRTILVRTEYPIADDLRSGPLSRVLGNELENAVRSDLMAAGASVRDRRLLEQVQGTGPEATAYTSASLSLLRDDVDLLIAVRMAVDSTDGELVTDLRAIRVRDGRVIGEASTKAWAAADSRSHGPAEDSPAQGGGASPIDVTREVRMALDALLGAVAAKY